MRRFFVIAGLVLAAAAPAAADNCVEGYTGALSESGNPVPIVRYSPPTGASIDQTPTRAFTADVVTATAAFVDCVV